MVPQTKTFLFINKDSSGLAINPSDSFNITSHVSRNHRRWLKNERQKKLTASRRNHRPLIPQNDAVKSTDRSTVDQDLTTTANNGSDLAGRRKVGSYPSGSAENTRNQSSQVPYSESGRRLLVGEGNNAQATLLNKQILSSTSCALRPYKGNTDPFNASALELTPAHSRAISLALQCLVFAAWPSDDTTVFRARLGDRSGSHIDLRRSIANEAELHAILASGYLTQATNVGHGQHTGSPQLNSQTLVHKGRSINMLRKQLQDGVTPDNILTLVRLLISLDFNAGDFASARVHLRGLINFCRHDARMNDNLREVVRTSDVWLAMALLSRPDIDPHQLDPGVPSTQKWYSMLKADQQQQFEHLAPRPETASVLGPDIDRLLLAAKGMVLTKQTIAIPGIQREKKQMVFWMSRRGSSTTGGLMVRYTEEMELAQLASEEASVLHHLRAASALAIILFMNFHWMDTPINYDFSRTFQAIEPLLRRCSFQVSQISYAAKLTLTWLCFICAMGDDIFAARGSRRFSGWAASEFARVCRLLELRHLAPVRAVLQYVAYNGDIMDEFLEVLLHPCASSTVETLLPFNRWKRILNHYVPD